MISITTQLNIDDYIKVNYHLVYSQWAIKGFVGFGIFCFILFLVTLLAGDFSWFWLIFGLFIIGGLRALVYISSRKTFKTDGRVSEKIEYQFDSQEIRINGESFNSRLTWDKIFRVTEAKDWILIWQNRQIANIIPKKDFKENELLSFKQIISGLPNIRSELK